MLKNSESTESTTKLGKSGVEVSSDGNNNSSDDSGHDDKDSSQCSK